MKNFWMWRLLQAFWGVLNSLRRFVLNVVFLAVLVITVYMLAHDGGVVVPERGALLLAPSGVLVEQAAFVDPIAEVMVPPEQRQMESELRDVIDAIDFAREDDRLSAIVLMLDGLLDADLAKTEAVGRALERFRQSGKKVVAYGDNYSQDQYALAAYADEIYLNPMGGVMLEGYGYFPSFFKELLDKLSIRFHVFRVGTYKSAVEPLLRNDMSPESREATGAWLNGRWQHYVRMVERRRGLPEQSINGFVNNMDRALQESAGDFAATAMKARLVDGLKQRDEFDDLMMERVGEDEEQGGFRQVHYLDYVDHMRLRHPVNPLKPRVGVIVARGVILDGEQPAGAIGGDSLAQQIIEARDDDNIKALVLRVDSEGGSAFASEIIRRELQLTQQAGIPVVVSMGSVAASGGYWIASTADEIWAEPTTITGSIGIFGAFPTLEDALGKLGVHSDGVATTEMAGAGSVMRSLSPLAERAIQLSVEDGYRRFLQRVAEGRKLPVNEVDKIAQGRVWTGVMAHELKLVDQLGGLDQAIDAAAVRAKLDDFEVEYLDKPLSAEEELVQRLVGQASSRGVLSGLPGMAELGALRMQLQGLAQPFSQLRDPRGLYAMCAECMAK